MNKYWISQSVVVGALLFAPQILFAREPKLADPCKEMRATLDNQVNTLHKQQNEELDQCGKTNGKDSDVCRNLKKQQELELNQARDHRQTELSSCSARLIDSIGAQRKNNESCGEYVQNQDNDYYDKHHKPPYKHSPDNPDKNPPVAHNPKTPDPGSHPYRDKDADNARNGGSSGSLHNTAGKNSGASTSSHGSSAPSGSGGSSGSSSSHSASTSSSSGSSSSGSNSSSSSSNAPFNSNSSGNSTSSNSGSSYSPPASSYSPPASSYSPPASSAPSHSDSGGSRPR